MSAFRVTEFVRPAYPNGGATVYVQQGFPSESPAAKGIPVLNVEGRHPAVREFADLFASGHLPPGLPVQVMHDFRALAACLLDLLPDGPMLTRALHDLWRAKNEAVAFAVRVQRDRDRSDQDGPAGGVGDAD